MPTSDKKSSPERVQTDTSLRTERVKADEELARERELIAEDADQVVRKARELADSTIDAARVKAEAELKGLGAAPAGLKMVKAEHFKEDKAISVERAAADATLLDEREERRLALKSLLHLERQETDEHLLAERDRFDHRLDNRDDFLGMVSHDLRSMVGGIALCAARIIKSGKSDEERAKTIQLAENIQRYSARMNRLLGDLVDVTSIEAGHLSVNPTEHDAVALVKSATEAFQPLALERKVSLEANASVERLLAKFDYERVLQVVGNLLSNAIKFTLPDGRINIGVEAAGPEIRFSVADSGTGIPPEKKEIIFERFWQASSNDRRGIGLGLFISKRIVEAHKGRIWVESASAKGTTFCFTLPAA